ncbi:Hypothetical predicted protein, partial [Paramuricea clavata]
MHQHFDDLEGVETDIDDILIHGTAEEEHYRRLESVLERCQKINLTLNKEKCEFKSREITYLDTNWQKMALNPMKRKLKLLTKWKHQQAEKWSFEQQKTFQDIKDTLAKDEGPVLKFFDVSKPTEISPENTEICYGIILKGDPRDAFYWPLMSKQTAEMLSKGTSTNHTLIGRYFEVVKLPDTKSSTVIKYTESIFSRHGIPAEV